MTSDGGHFSQVPTSAGGLPELPSTIAEGQTISMKVLNVLIDTFQVEGACDGKSLESAVWGTLAQKEAQRAAAAAKKNARSYQKRRIGHPLFKNGTLEQVAKVLDLAPVGEVTFRPSSKGTSHLTASVKVTEKGPLLHLDILEQDKPSESELGASLFIGAEPEASALGGPPAQGDRFDDLDEICARYIEIAVYL